MAYRENKTQFSSAAKLDDSKGKTELTLAALLHQLGEEESGEKRDRRGTMESVARSVNATSPLPHRL